MQISDPDEANGGSKLEPVVGEGVGSVFVEDVRFMVVEVVGVGVGSLLAAVVGFVLCNRIRLMCAEDVAFVVGDEGGYVTMVLDWKQKGWGFGLEKPLVACLSMIISLDESLVKE